MSVKERKIANNIVLKKGTKNERNPRRMYSNREVNEKKSERASIQRRNCSKGKNETINSSRKRY